jgi:hypothetical protein
MQKNPCKNSIKIMPKTHKNSIAFFIIAKNAKPLKRFIFLIEFMLTFCTRNSTISTGKHDEKFQWKCRSRQWNSSTSNAAKNGSLQARGYRRENPA